MHSVVDVEWVRRGLGRYHKLQHSSNHRQPLIASVNPQIFYKAIPKPGSFTNYSAANMIDIMENNSVITAMLDLKLRDEDGSLKSVINLPVDVLKQYCHLDQVANFANLTLFIYNSNSTATYSEISDTSIPYTLKLLLSVLFILVGCIGFVGNVLTVLVIYKTASLHSHTNYFLASLAISDLCLIIVGVPFDLFHLWRKDRPPAITGYCAFMSTSISLFTFASILTIVSLTAERFVAICYPFSHRALFDKRRVIYLIYLIWIIAFFPSLYIGLQFKRVVPDFCGYNRELDSQRGSCDYVTSQNIPFRYPFELTMVVTFVLPLIFIVYCYVRILATLNEMAAATRVHVPIGNTNSTDSAQPSILYVHTKNYAPPKSQQAQRMVIKMLSTVTAVFFVCYLPYHIERLIVQYTKQQCDSSMFCFLLYPVTGLLQYISATLNPIFYNLMSTRFRTAFTQLLHQILPKHDQNYGSIARI
ncbi:hypothetical protein RB195_021413 [Necator americanus]